MKTAVALLVTASNLPRKIKVLIAMCADFVAIMAALITASTLRLESIAFIYDVSFLLTATAIAVISVMIFFVLGLYKTIVRFVTGKVLTVVTIGSLLSGILILVASALDAYALPTSVFALHAVFLTLFVTGSRFIVRSAYRRPVNKGKTPVIIFGAGSAGLQLMNSLFHGQEYLPVALTDDNVSLHNYHVSGLKVCPPASLPYVISSTGASLLLLATPTMSRERRRKLLEDLEGVSITLKRIPKLSEIISGQAQISELQPLTTDDLLGRDSVPPDTALMSSQIAGKRVFISGAGGSIGKELCRQIIRLGPLEMILLELSEYALYSIELELRDLATTIRSQVKIVPALGSILDQALLDSLFKDHRPQTVYHAAAYKHVPLVESNVVTAVQNNVTGTANLAHTAVKYEVSLFTLISTDKAVRPTNIMGASKRCAELICQSFAAEPAHNTTFAMVRFGNVLGSSGSVIPRFQSQLDQGGPLTVTHPDITRYFMTIPEAAQLVIQAGSMANGGDVFLLDMGKPVKILDLAKNMARLSGYIPVIGQDEIGTKSPNQIQIKIVGLRPGEKLFEELLIDGSPQPTAHPRIFRAVEADLDVEHLNREISLLTSHLDAGDIEKVIASFKNLPLQYKPEPSPAQTTTNQ